MTDSKPKMLWRVQGTLRLEAYFMSSATVREQAIHDARLALEKMERDWTPDWQVEHLLRLVDDSQIDFDTRSANPTIQLVDGDDPRTIREWLAVVWDLVAAEARARREAEASVRQLKLFGEEDS